MTPAGSKTITAPARCQGGGINRPWRDHAEAWALATASQEKRQDAERDEYQDLHPLGDEFVYKSFGRAGPDVLSYDGGRDDAHERT
jgi:hypothetical protein